MTLVHVPVRELPRPFDDAHGDQWEWGLLVPSAWQALADPRGMHPWPTMPTVDGPGDIPLQGWFTPAVQLLAYSVAWPSLGLGALRWSTVAGAVEDPRLSLVDEMLGERRDELLAWLVTSDWPSTVAAGAAQAVGASKHDPTIAPDREWLAEVERNAASRAWGPYGGGTDPIHLAVHSMAPASRDCNGARLLLADADRSAVVFVDRYAGWYSALGQLGGELPPRRDGRSWRVDVVCRPIGWLGTFRRSRLTGRWFSGRHSIHTLGWSDG